MLLKIKGNSKKETTDTGHQNTDVVVQSDSGSGDGRGGGGGNGGRYSRKISFLKIYITEWNISPQRPILLIMFYLPIPHNIWHERPT